MALELSVDVALFSALRELGAGREAFRARVELAFSFVRTTKLAQLLDPERDGAVTRAYLESFAGQIEHVGIMAAAGMTVDDVAAAASAAGFDLRPTSFPSQLVARELGTLSGVERVPTTIFRASADGINTRRVGVEVFIPHTDADTIHRWILEGVVSHIAIELQRPHDSVFDDVAHRLEAAGFTIPAFLVPRPFYVPHPTDDLRTLYFDRAVGPERSRIEVFALGDLAPRPKGRRATDVPSEHDRGSS
jgi:hypothetical protein